MIITEAKDEDVQEISKIALEEFSYANQSLDKILTRKKKGALIFKAIEHDKLMGFVDFEINGENAMINALTVVKEFRGKKVGTHLAKFAVNFLALRGVKKINLLVKQENFAAKKIYEKLGFKFLEIYEKKIENHVVEKMELNIITTDAA